MSITSEKIDYIIKVGIHPALKRIGFLKSARTFRRVRTNCIQIINVQGSWTNYNDQGSFTVNLAVYFPKADELHGLFQIIDHPTESDCMVNERIGHLMPVKGDYWWKIDAKSDLDEIAEELAFACVEYGIPWLEEHSTIEGAIQFFTLSRKNPYWAAIFSIILGNHQNAKKYLDEAISNASPNPELKSHLESWGRSVGLIL
jgi:hypothetical protein